MRVKVKTHDGLFEAEFEADSHTAIVQEIASFQEIFGENTCGKCKGTDTRFLIRTAASGGKTYTYHEHQCNDKQCRRKLALGVKDDGTGTLFPKRKYGKDHAKNGEWLKNNGWVRWNKDTEDYE